MRLLNLERLSKHADRQTGLRSQDADNKDWARDNGHVIVHTASDFKSGRTPLHERPNAKAWFTDPDLIVQYDGVLVSVVDRLTRGDKQETTEIEQWAREHGKVLLTTTGAKFPAEGDEGRPWDNDLRSAHEEWRKCSRRYKRAQAERKQAGSFVGRPPWGFHLVKQPDGRKLPVLHEDGEKYVPEIFRLCDEEDLSTLAIAAWLDERGAETAAHRVWRLTDVADRGPEPTSLWSPVTVAGIIRNPFYKGEHRERLSPASPIRYGKLIMKIDSPVDRDVWQRANDRLSNRGGRGPSKPEKAMLSGGRVLFCLDCGAAMYRMSPRDAPEYYTCSNRAHQTKVTHLAVLDKAVSDFMLDNHDPIKARRRIPGHNHEAEIEEVRFLKKSLVDQDLPEEEEGRRLAELNAEIARLKTLPRVEDRVEDVELDLTYAQKWESLPTAERGGWLRSLGITVHARHDMAEIRDRDGLAMRTVFYTKLPRRKPGPKPRSEWAGTRERHQGASPRVQPADC
jgi:DNA invertase Pin-like site-specific DNA recombinase